MRLLLVEDDNMLGASLKKGLGFEHYSVEWVTGVDDARTALLSTEFDLAIVDINLPDGSGLDVLATIRNSARAQHLPVLLLTVINHVEQKVIGLDAGADDYLTKPFDLKELLARLRLITRRHQGKIDNVLRVRDMELDLNSKQLRKSDFSYTPTASEFKLLALLMRRPGTLISKRQMEEELYGWDGDAESNTVEVTIYNLRKKLGKDVITTLRGVGYMVSA